VGPEAPLVLGLVDALAAAKIPAFGPTAAAARLEGSKVFMKDFLARHGIATAAHRVFDDAEEARRYIAGADRPLVVKADGLCAGKGVVVASTPGEAIEAATAMLQRRVFGDAGARIVVEELLPGEEASFHVVCDGERFVALPAAQDHKRVRDGDQGPNTGGMGAYAPAPVVTDAVRDAILSGVIEPTLAGMHEEGVPFRGVLFVGLMIDAGVPRVLEFNVRFGDPEATVLLPLYDGDLHDLLAGAAAGDLRGASSSTRDLSALSVVLAAEGYPGEPRTGDAISGAEDEVPRGAWLLHAGTRRTGGQLVTSGGRVLVAGATGRSLREARDRAYEVTARVRFAGEHHRTDIGHHALRTSAADAP
jgi:phosphoribosylamine--glycine ligase